MLFPQGSSATYNSSAPLRRLTLRSLDYVDISAQITVDQKFGQPSSVGDLAVFPPFAADGIGLFNTTSLTFSMVNLRSKVTTSGNNPAMFFASAAIGNTVVLTSAELNPPVMGIFDVVTHAFSTIDISAHVVQVGAFGGGEAVGDDLVVFFPLADFKILMYNVTSQAVDFVDVAASGLSSNAPTYVQKYYEAGLVGTKLVMPPFDANGVGIFDVSTRTFTLKDISASLDSGFRPFYGAAAVGDEVIFSPYCAGGVGVYNVVTDTFTLVDIKFVIHMCNKFYGATTTSSSPGLVFFAQDQASGIGVFDAYRRQFSMLDM